MMGGAQLPGIRGSVAVEALISLPLLLLLAGGLIDYGLILRENAVIVSAARAGARAAAAATLSDASSDPGPPGTSIFLCMLAKQSSKKFLEESRLDSSHFDIEVAPASVEVTISTDDPPLDPVAGITVKVSHKTPRWFFFWRNATQASASSTFATESGDLPADCGDPL